MSAPFGTRVAPRPRKSLEDFDRELRERQDAHRRKLLERQDALSDGLRRYAKKRAVRIKAGRRVARRERFEFEVRIAAQRERETREAFASASGELLALMEEQAKDMRRGDWVKRSPVFVDVRDQFKASQLGLVP